MMKIGTLLAVACAWACSMAAQSTDSLTGKLAGAEGVERVEVLLELSYLLGQNAPDSALYFANEAYRLSQSLKYKRGMASALHKKSIVWRYNGMYTEAIALCDSALGLLQEGKSEQALQAAIYQNMGVNYKYQGAYERALEAFQKSIALYRDLGMESDAGVTLNSVGVLHMTTGNYQQALDYYFEALGVQRSTGNLKEQANIYNNIAIVYANQGYLDSALTYFTESYEMEKSMGNRRGMSESLNNIGAVYAYMDQPLKAIEQFEQSHAIDSLLGDERGQIVCKNNIAEMLIALGRAEEALSLLRSNLVRARRIQSVEEVAACINNMAHAYSELGRYEDAFTAMVAYTAAQDSVVGRQQQRALADMETRYQTAQKEQQIKIQELQIQEKDAALHTRQVAIAGLSGGLLLLLVLGVIGFLLYKARRENAVQRVLAKLQEERLNAVIDATENERKRIARELHDGIGQQLTSVKMGMGQLLRRAAHSDLDVTRRVEALQKIVDDSAKDVRSLSHSMMPRALTEVGLAAAISDMLARTAELCELELSFDQVGCEGRRFDEKVEINLYRVAQELVNNSVKHSQGSRIDVELLYNGTRLVLLVSDDGHGLPPDQKPGHGMLNIASRLEQIGGKMDAGTASAPGASFHISVPVTHLAHGQHSGYAA